MRHCKRSRVAERTTAARTVGLLATLLSICAAGCQLWQDRPRTFAEADTDLQTANKKQEEFRETASPDAIRWLLTHEVEQGMTLDAVEQAIGQPGSLVVNDGMYKRNDVRIRESDKTYRWGPDSEGQTWILFFRGNRLTNFDPADFVK